MPQNVNTGITLFTNEKFGNVRVVMHEGVPWFVASAVAKALGFANPSDAINRHCKKTIKTPFNVIHEGGNNPVQINLIPESDMYRLIMRSNTPLAEEFQDWVTEEVLPSIRRTGKYEVTQSDEVPLLMQQMQELHTKIAKLEEDNAVYREWMQKLIDAGWQWLAERKQLTAERDKAVQEKAWIGSKREASAMGTASAARKAERKWKNAYLLMIRFIPLSMQSRVIPLVERYVMRSPY